MQGLLTKTFKNKKILITGHTGFKGSWLTIWLNSLGANVIGIALDPPDDVPSHFTLTEIGKEIIDYRFDIRDREQLKDIFLKNSPDFVFHLAAQPIVKQSYIDPIETWDVNLMGTINVLESLRVLKNSCTAIFVTSDKCYDNVEWVWGYKETDALGGPDPYSASKGAAEIAIKSYVKSFFIPGNSNVKISTARAGNVIGGGDWAKDRIIPDCVKAWSESKKVELRNPNSTRPWQHVLEPLSGYLSLAVELERNWKLHGESFNFGPNALNSNTVLNLVEEMSLYWGQVKWEDTSESYFGPYESGLLKLNCDKALYFLKWMPTLNFKQTIQLTAEWYAHYYDVKNDIRFKTLQQINQFYEIAKKQNIEWAVC